MARAIFLLILPLTLFGGEEFIFWAKLLAQNNILKSQNIAISRALTSSVATYSKLCEIHSVKLASENSLQYLHRHKNELFDCFISSEIRLLDTSIASTSSVATSTHFTLAPVRFILDFNDAGAIISKQENR